MIVYLIFSYFLGFSKHCMFWNDICIWGLHSIKLKWSVGVRRHLIFTIIQP